LRVVTRVVAKNSLTEGWQCSDFVGALLGVPAGTSFFLVLCGCNARTTASCKTSMRFSTSRLFYTQTQKEKASGGENPDAFKFKQLLQR